MYLTIQTNFSTILAPEFLYKNIPLLSKVKKIPQTTVLADYQKLPDEELIHRYAHRNEETAFSCLFGRYSHLVYGVCLKYLKDVDAAKDASQQIFIKLLEDLKRFEIKFFKSWLYQVAKNQCLMILRKDKATGEQELEEDNIVEFEDDWHQRIEKEDLLDHLEKAVKELKSDQRICVEYFYLHKMSYAEIARQTSYDLNRVKSAIQNGKRNLKLKLTPVVKGKNE